MENSAPTGEPSKTVQDLANLIARRTTEAAWTPFTYAACRGAPGAFGRTDHESDERTERKVLQEKATAKERFPRELARDGIRKMNKYTNAVLFPSTEAPGL
jgi:hypothetical protein